MCADGEDRGDLYATDLEDLLAISRALASLFLSVLPWAIHIIHIIQVFDSY